LVPVFPAPVHLALPLPLTQIRLEMTPARQKQRLPSFFAHAPTPSSPASTIEERSNGDIHALEDDGVGHRDGLSADEHAEAREDGGEGLEEL
jgi:hypothetical protein